MGRTLAAIVLLASAFAFATPARACVCYDSAGTEKTIDGTDACRAADACGNATATENATSPGICDCGTRSETINCSTVCTDNGYALAAPSATSATITPTVGYAIPQLNVRIPGVDFTVPTEQSGVATSTFIGTYVTGVYRYLVGFAMTVAIVMMMVGGLQYVMGASSGDVKGGKKRIADAIEGLVLLMFVSVILFTVNPELVLFRPLSIGNVARVVWEEQAKENLAQCGAEKGTQTPCSTTTLKMPAGWTSQALVDAINAAATKKGVDANLVAAHVQMESGGNINYGKATGPCGEVGPSQFMPTTAESITDADCCVSIVRGPNKSVTDGEKSACTKTLNSPVWPPSKTDFPTRCEAMCGNCQVASASCAERFGKPENVQFIIDATAELVSRNLAMTGNDFALEMCAYNGSGKAAAAYAEKAKKAYDAICETSKKP